MWGVRFLCCRAVLCNLSCCARELVTLIILSSDVLWLYILSVPWVGLLCVNKLLSAHMSRDM